MELSPKAEQLPPAAHPHPSGGLITNLLDVKISQLQLGSMHNCAQGTVSFLMCIIVQSHSSRVDSHTHPT